MAGKDVRCLLDTGAAVNTLYPLFVSKSAPDLVRQLRASTNSVFTEINDRSVVYSRIGVGGVELPTGELRFHNMARIVEPDDRPIDCAGIVGAPFLRYHSAVIDYGSDTLYLLDPAEREAGLQGDWREADLVSEGERLTGFPGRTAVATLSVRGVRGVFACAGTTQEFDLSLDLKTTPRGVDWVYPNGFRKPLIYKLDGDTLTVCGQLFQTAQKRTERPTEFVSRAGTAVSVLTLKRVAKK